MVNPETGKTEFATSFNEDDAWGELSSLLGEFCDLWSSAPPAPDIELFAQRLDSVSNERFQHVGVTELVKVDLEYRSKDQFESRDLAYYFDRWPSLGQIDSPPAEIEATIRRFQSGQDSKNHETRELDPDFTQSISLNRARPVHELSPGDSIDDFDLLIRLGRGAFATVFLANQKSMQRLVALKISADQGLEGPTLAKLNHPHVVRVFDQRIISERQIRLMYMEYVEGGTLASVVAQADLSPEDSARKFLKSLDLVLAERDYVPPVDSANRILLAEATWTRAVARIGAQLASAIRYTHQQGVLHRDIKPANILLDSNAYPKLVDFNISFGEGVIGATAASCFGGTLSYMSPEQLEAFHPDFERKPSEVDGSCDVFALGATLCVALTGCGPFDEPKSKDPLRMVNEMITRRREGIDTEKRKQLRSICPLLGSVIESALLPDSLKRPSTDSMQRQLNWASKKSICEFLQPPKTASADPAAWVAKYPSFFVVLIVFGIAVSSTWFIIAYNVTESVSGPDQDLFQSTRKWINRTVFPLALLMLVMMFYNIRQLLCVPDKFASIELHRGMVANFSFGHRVAIMTAVLWVVAGCLYPVVLSLRGAKLPTSAWSDFAVSHVLAGLISAAFVFFGLTSFSTSVWHPKLMLARFKRGEVEFDAAPFVNQLRERVYWYRVIAIGAPLVAIAILVNFRSTNQFAVSFLSVTAIVFLAAMARAIRTIQRSLDVIEEMSF